MRKITKTEAKKLMKEYPGHIFAMQNFMNGNHCAIYSADRLDDFTRPELKAQGYRIFTDLPQ
jgi:hypothetical protein